MNKKWVSWESLEQLIKTFKYKGRDANSRPPCISARKMKVKSSRKVIGTFSEIGNFIRSMTQLLFDHIVDTQDEYWLWLLEIRKFLKFVLMPKVTESQLEQMELTLTKMMNLRLKLTRVNEKKPTIPIDDLELSEIDDAYENNDMETIYEIEAKKSKYMVLHIVTIYHNSENSFRANYSFLSLALCTHWSLSL